MAKKYHDTITDVPGISVGHAQDEQGLTGCTVILCEAGAVGGVDQRGGAPGTRETDLLRPMHMVERLHAILLSGGSAYGLDAAAGVMRYLEEREIGFDVRVAKVPIVPGAILFDLDIGDAKARPDATMGYNACANASSDPVVLGNAGAGMGARVGTILGIGKAVKAGIGSASEKIGGGIFVGAIAAVNAFGDVIDPNTQEIIAGARTMRQGPLHIGREGIFADTMSVMKSMVGRTILGIAARSQTIIAVVATNARLNKEQANQVALMAHDGIAHVVRPSHTTMDGDTIFAISCGNRKVDVNIIGSYAANTLARAIIKGVWATQPAGGLPSASSILAQTNNED